jgi:hypothetical protein
MVDKVVDLIETKFGNIFDSIVVKKTCKNNIDYYHIMTNKPFNLVVSYEYNDNIWNLYATYNKNSSIEEIELSELESLSGKHGFYKAQNKYVIKQIGFIKYILNSRGAYEHYIQFFAKYVRENIEYL